MKRALFLTVVVALVSFAAAQYNPIEVRIEGFIVTPDGTFTPATSARPSQVVEYWVFARNIDPTTMPADSVSVNGPAPESSLYIPGSASRGDDFRVEFTDGVNFSDSETMPVQAVRWTYLQPLEPGEEIKMTYRVVIGDVLPETTYAEFSGFSSAEDEADTSSGGYGSADDFTQAMFGHLGVIQVDCPASESNAATCGEYSNSFDLFRQSWDLYADYEGEVPVIPTPKSAWRSSGSLYVRDYDLNGSSYSVNFLESEDGGFVSIYTP